jgi:hypothetical protein
MQVGRFQRRGRVCASSRSGWQQQVADTRARYSRRAGYRPRTSCWKRQAATAVAGHGSRTASKWSPVATECGWSNGLRQRGCTTLHYHYRDIIRRLPPEVCCSQQTRKERNEMLIVEGIVVQEGAAVIEGGERRVDSSERRQAGCCCRSRYRGVRAGRLGGCPGTTAQSGT